MQSIPFGADMMNAPLIPYNMQFENRSYGQLSRNEYGCNANNHYHSNNNNHPNYSNCNARNFMQRAEDTNWCRICSNYNYNMWNAQTSNNQNVAFDADCIPDNSGYAGYQPSHLSSYSVSNCRFSPRQRYNYLPPYSL
eukprot:TRINITY_DN23481_c0_g1_i1.p2 TRINITY_DN23481_c0_g1~~TRINITY_DN23481_c0_g1_i1.p2  ORF type:complete len:138 (+),score=3.61 TRINITY_DN23481_c0_g1_i1:213-626(+)